MAKKLGPKKVKKLEPKKVLARTKRGSKCLGGSCQNKQSQKTKELIIKYYLKGLSASATSRIIKKSQPYVSRIIRKEREKTPSLNYIKKTGQTLEPKSQKLEPNSKFNVHAQRIRCFVHWSGKKYNFHPNSNIKDFVEGVDVQCMGKLIYLRANGLKFKGSSEVKALENSLSFWEGVIHRLEDRLNIAIFKPKCVAFEFVYQESETSNSEICRDADRRGIQYRVFHPEDGKLRLTTDHSLKGDNTETHHYRDNHQDQLTINKHFNSVLDNPHGPTFTELVNFVNVLALSNKDALDGLNAAAGLIKALVPQEAKGSNSEVEYDNTYIG